MLIKSENDVSLLENSLASCFVILWSIEMFLQLAIYLIFSIDIFFGFKYMETWA